jgi:hypothetical protein
VPRGRHAVGKGHGGHFPFQGRLASLPKFGDALRSKTKTAQINEALCKVLCHNICCLIQSMFELNLKPKFWAEVA